MRPAKLATAEWADLDEFSEAQAFQKGMFWLGRMPHNGQAVGYADDRHICLVSGTRSGKGTTSIIPNLCLWEGSAVVVDPKGENATVTASRRGNGSDHAEGMGQKVRVLDPFKVAQVADEYRATYNPLDSLDPNDPNVVDEAGRLADAVVVIPPGSNEPYWDEQARSLIKCLILHVLTHQDFEGERTLLTVRDLILRGAAKQVEILRSRGHEALPDPQEFLWLRASKNEALGGTIAGLAASFYGMARSSKRTYYSVHSHAVQQTEFLDSPGMREGLKRSTFELHELKTHAAGVSLYLSLPRRYMGEHFRWLRMLITLTVGEMEAVPGKPATGHPVLFCLDEFAGLKRMSVLEDAVAQLAGFGVKLLFVLQTLEQLKATYGENWETFLANAGLKIVAGVDDHFTRDYVSKYVGEMEIIRAARSTQRSTQRTEQTGETETSSESVTESESWQTSEGGSEGRSISRGGGSSDSYKLTIMGLRGIAETFRDVVGGRQRTDSSSWGSQTSDGTNWNKGRGGSNATQTGFSLARSKSRSTSEGENEGHSENITTRPLVRPDEIGTLFARVDDPALPAFPGLAMVNITARSACPVLKTNYFDDIAFADKFDPHPDHGEIAWWEISPLLQEKDREAMEKLGLDPGEAPVLVQPGDYLKPGQVIVEVPAVPDLMALREADKLRIEYQARRNAQNLPSGLPRGLPRELPKTTAFFKTRGRGFLTTDSPTIASGATVLHRGEFALEEPDRLEDLIDADKHWTFRRADFFKEWLENWIRIRSLMWLAVVIPGIGAAVLFDRGFTTWAIVAGVLTFAASASWNRLNNHVKAVEALRDGDGS